MCISIVCTACQQEESADCTLFCTAPCDSLLADSLNRHCALHDGTSVFIPVRQTFISTENVPLIPLKAQAQIRDWNDLCFVSEIAAKMFVYSSESCRETYLHENSSRFAFVTSPYTDMRLLLAYLSEDTARAFQVNETYSTENDVSVHFMAGIRLFNVHRMVRMNASTLADPDAGEKWNYKKGKIKSLSRVDMHYCEEQLYKFFRQRENKYAIVDKIVVAENYDYTLKQKKRNGKSTHEEHCTSPVILGYICKSI